MCMGTYGDQLNLSAGPNFGLNLKSEFNLHLHGLIWLFAKCL